MDTKSILVETTCKERTSKPVQKTERSQTYTHDRQLRLKTEKQQTDIVVDSSTFSSIQSSAESGELQLKRRRKITANMLKLMWKLHVNKIDRTKEDLIREICRTRGMGMHENRITRYFGRTCKQSEVFFEIPDRMSNTLIFRLPDQKPIHLLRESTFQIVGIASNSRSLSNCIPGDI